MQYVGNNIRKENDFMSFVSMHLVDDGIIAISDSKASIAYKSGEIREDKRRGKIPKIFSNNKFIFIYHGNNELFSYSNKTTMEDYVENNLKDDIGFEAFFQKMFYELCDSKPEYNDGKYYFIVGGKEDKDRYFILKIHFDIQNNIIQYSSKDYRYTYYSGGYDMVMNIYNQYPFYHDINIFDYAKELKWLLTHIIESVDTISKAYNPVGLPVNVKVFQWLCL